MRMSRSNFFQDAFTKCVHISKFLDIKGPELHHGHKNRIYFCIIICPKKFKFAHNVFEVTELCRTRADILKPTLDRTLLASLKYKQNPQCRSFGVDMWAEKELINI